MEDRFFRAGLIHRAQRSRRQAKELIEIAERLEEQASLYESLHSTPGTPVAQRSTTAESLSLDESSAVTLLTTYSPERPD